ncbi:hypothetical protein [Nocardiopsis ansamitocini]|uniref:hypothetical protein n=1 Tax=Nocardiopsis ansamitocini TaxID=1670832 RepID=UPI0025562077|nr:hypothetical protein [Nocardiopsis ansamitocini]
MTETGVLTLRGFAPLAGPVARWSRRRGVTPAGAARIGLFITVAAAVWFTAPGVRSSLVGSVLLAAVLFTDAVGLRLARSRPWDPLTAWAVPLLAQLRECVLCVGLAIGGVVAGIADAWAWAAGALIALALREAVRTARAAALASGPSREVRQAPGRVPGQRRPSPIDAVDPSRHGRVPADASFTDELLGKRVSNDDRPGAEGNPVIPIRTTPPTRGEGLRPLAAGPDRPAPPRARAGIAPPTPLGPLRALGRFAQSERFFLIAVTVTIWDVRVTFIALIVGSVLAVAGELADPVRPTS